MMMLSVCWHLYKLWSHNLPCASRCEDICGEEPWLNPNCSGFGVGIWAPRTWRLWLWMEYHSLRIVMAQTMRNNWLRGHLRGTMRCTRGIWKALWQNWMVKGKSCWEVGEDDGKINSQLRGLEKMLGCSQLAEMRKSCHPIQSQVMHS